MRAVLRQATEPVAVDPSADSGGATTPVPPAAASRTSERSLSFLTTLQHHARLRPDHVAVIDERESITYGELAEQVNCQGAALRRAGMEAGDRVALVAENSARFLVSAFAVWRAGGVLVTIYPSSGQSDLAFSIGSSDPVLLLTDRHTADTVLSANLTAIPTVLIDAPFVVDRLAIPAERDPDAHRSLVLICYTSGSTSRPKAVMISAEAVDNGALTSSEVWHLSTEDVTLVCLPMAWLYGLNTTSMATLLAGGTVVALRRAQPDLILEAVSDRGATFLAGVTTMYVRLVDHLDRLARRSGLSSLRLCVSGGEPRNEAAFERWRHYAGVPVHDTFCASECFPLITYDPHRDPEPVPGSAGRLVQRSELRVVDRAGNARPPGEVGEAWSRGPGLLLGYWKDPEQTALVLTEDGWYRTQDLVRIDSDGYVHVVGRISDMILRGGANVSPAEVERVLRGHRTVRDVAVVGLPDPVYGQRVVAVVVLVSGEALDEAALAVHGSQHLARYKIPTEYHVVPQLPQNATTGKVDRRQIAAVLMALTPDRA